MTLRELPCFPLILERHINFAKEKEPEAFEKYYPDVEMRMFPQTWGSTALGFGGVGGQAMTSAYTIVVIDDISGYCSVFFGERLAYSIKNPAQTFFDDVAKERMESVNGKGKYIRNE